MRAWLYFILTKIRKIHALTKMMKKYESPENLTRRLYFCGYCISMNYEYCISMNISLPIVSRKRTLKSADHLVHILLLDYKRRHKTQHIRAGAQNDQPLFQCFFYNLANRAACDNDALHQSFSSAQAQAVVLAHQLIELLLQIWCDILYMLHDLLLFKQIEYL